MLESFAPILVLLGVASFFPFLVLFVASLIRSKPPKNAVRDTSYECGLETIGQTWIQFNVRYYLYALAFVIFDIETVFLFPWAVSFKQLGLFAAIEMLIFLVILAAGLGYAWRKRALDWR